ncbi:MAG: DUF748 domain-containing protein [Deltaproteobacteria bacterium]|nr:DUF748 domain-containing protein [Deltaproteobacteria bacterium]
MAKKNDDPFGSITIAPDTDKRPAGHVDLDLSIDQPASEKEKPPARPAEPDDFRPTRIPRRRSKVRPSLPWISISLAAFTLFFFLAYACAGFFGVPYFLKKIAPQIMEKRLNRPITFGSASFNPFTLRLIVHNAIIGPDLGKPDDQIDPLFSAGAIEADLSWSSFFGLQLNCSRLAVDNLFLHLVKNEENSYNLAEILPFRQHMGFPVPYPPFAYLLRNITVTNSRIIFDDLPAHKSHNLEQINLDLPLLFQNIDNDQASKPALSVSNSYINPKFSAIINGSPINLTGKTKVEGEKFEAQLQLNFNAVDLPAYLSYLPAHQNFTLDKGTADVLMDITFSSGPQETLDIEIETTSHLSDVSLRDQGKHISTIPAATVSATIHPLTSTYVFKEITLTNPVLHLGRLADGHWFFPVIVPTQTADQENSAKKKNFIINRLTVSDGTLTITDQKVKGGFAETVANLSCTMADMNSQIDQPVSFALSGVTSEKSTISIQGEITPATLSVKGLLVGSQTNLQRFSPYLPEKNLKITQGKIDNLQSRFTLDNAKDQAGSLTLFDTSLDLDNIMLTAQEQNYASVPKARITFAKLEPKAARLEKLTVSTDSAEIFMNWDKENKFNWSLPGEADGAEGDGRSWHISLSALDMMETRVHIENNALPTPIKLALDKVKIHASDLATASPEQQGNVLIETEDLGGGALTLTGPARLSPFSATLACRLQGYKLETLPSLVTDWLNITGLAGEANVQGEVKIPHFSYAGALSILNFNATREKGADLIKLDRADATGMEFNFRPFSLKIGDLSCDKSYLRWLIPVQGPINIGDLFSRRSPGLTDYTNNGQIAIEHIILRDATLDFADQRVTPVYSSKLIVNGTADNLINAKSNRLHLDITSSTAPETAGNISGELGFFDDSLYADINATLRNLPIAGFSPYLASRLGYRLREGMLDFSTVYHQEGDKVTSSNTLLITGLKLGEPQGSAPSQLPLTLAILTGQQGDIKLNLPVTGSISDAAYSLPSSLGRALRNIVLKSTVSPFAQLQESFADLAPYADSLLFAPGKADLSEDNKKFLNLLGQMMMQRPLLSLTVKGYASSGTDYETMLAAKKAEARQRDLAQEQKKSAQATQAYGKEEIPPAGQQKTVSVPAPPVVAISVAKSELLQLAKKRQGVVVDFLVANLKIAKTRVIQDSNPQLVAADAPGRQGNRLDLKLGSAAGK